MLVALDYRIDFAMPTQIRDRNASSWRTTRVPPIEVSTERTRASRANRRPRAAPGTPAPVQRVGHEVDRAALVRPLRERHRRPCAGGPLAAEVGRAHVRTPVT